MNASNELREKMWELCYDLLPDGERSALIAQIKSDPQAARLYAEVRLQADLVGFAAKVEDSSLILTAAGEKSKIADSATIGRQTSPETSADRQTARATWATWIPAVAALVLIGLIVGGLYTPQGREHQLVQAVIEIDAPASMPAGVSSKIVLRARQPGSGGAPSQSPVDIKIVGEDGRTVFQEMVKPGADGVATVELPGQVIVPGVRLEAESAEKVEETVAMHSAAPVPTEVAAVDSLAAALPVSTAPPVLYYMFETPVAQGGEEVRFAAIALERFTLQTKPPEVEKLVLKDAEGSSVVEPMWQVQDNLIEGVVVLPQSAGRSSLAASNAPSLNRFRSMSGKEIAPEAPLAEISRAQDESAALRLQQEAKGDQVRWVADNSRRLYLDSETRLTREGLERKPEEVLSQLAKQVVRAESVLPEQSAQTEWKQKESELAGRLDGVTDSQQIVEPGQPVEFEIPAELADKRIVAEVFSRGVSVARQLIDKSTAADAASQGNERALSATLHVPPEADGEMRLKLSDASQSPPKVVRERLLYRRPVRELKLQPQNLAARYDPGQVVSLQLKVVDENGEPTSALLGIRAWREDVVPARQDHMMLADTVRQLDEGETRLGVEFGFGEASERQLAMGRRSMGTIALAEELDKKQLSAGVEASPPAPATAPGLTPPAVEVAKEADPAAVNFGGGMPADQVGALGGTGPVSSNAYFAASGDVSLLVSNRAVVESRFQAQKQESDRVRQAWQALMGRVLVGGGLVVLAVMGLLFLLRMPVRAGGGTLALVAAAASLVVGVFWSGGQRDELSLAMATNEAAQTTPELPAETPPRSSAGSDDAAPMMDDATYPLAAAAPAEPPPAPNQAPSDPAGPLAGSGDLGPLGTPLPSTPRAADPAPTSGDLSRSKSISPVPERQMAGQAGEARKDDKSGVELFAVSPAKPAADDSGGAKDAQSDEKKQADKVTAAGEPATVKAEMRPSGGAGAGGGLGGFGAAAPGGGKSARFAEGAGLEDAIRPSAGEKAADAPVAATTATTPAPAGDAERSFRRGGVSQARDRLTTAPAAIYFNPRLATDEQGVVTLEFQLPEVESQYRLLIDAFGNGRVGSSAELRIVCQKGEAK